METRVDEIAPDVFRLSTHIPDVAPPAGFAFNQFLIRGEEPFLFHTGMRALFPLVSDAVGRLLGGIERLRWISFAHVEADECGAMNELLAAAPHAAVTHGELACNVSLNDLADRPPVVAGDPLDIGGHRLRFLPTPHVPHNWESGLWFDETTGTLLAGDLFTAMGDGPAVADDLLDGAIVGEEAFHFTSIGSATAPTIRGLADLTPTTLACMHGPSFSGDGGDQLRRLAAYYEQALVAL
ncbi:MAG TPA: MBL fold metallo-hydrolase [Ilumatobacter sp.]|nr:MBL fold metallo-hydrolase [Ilumatobacter sp.]